MTREDMLNIVSTLGAITILMCLITVGLGFNQIHLLNDLEKAKKNPVIEYKNIPNKLVGEFSITHYCSCPICTGTPKGSNTATGHKPKQGRTVAVDPKVIPLHSIIYVEGVGYFVAEDIGGGVKGNHIDIYVDDHQEALKLGTLGGKKVKVYLLDNNLNK